MFQYVRRGILSSQVLEIVRCSIQHTHHRDNVLVEIFYQQVRASGINPSDVLLQLFTTYEMSAVFLYPSVSVQLASIAGKTCPLAFGAPTWPSTRAWRRCVSPAAGAGSCANPSCCPSQMRSRMCHPGRRYEPWSGNLCSWPAPAR